MGQAAEGGYHPTIVGDKCLETGWLFIEKLDAQLHVALVSLCRDEALTVVKNSGKRQGLNAWRRLNSEYEPNNPQANLRLLKRILQPAGAPVSLDALRQAIESWERG